MHFNDKLAKALCFVVISGKTVNISVIKISGVKNYKQGHHDTLKLNSSSDTCL